MQSHISTTKSAIEIDYKSYQLEAAPPETIGEHDQ